MTILGPGLGVGSVGMEMAWLTDACEIGAGYGSIGSGVLISERSERLRDSALELERFSFEGCALICETNETKGLGKFRMILKAMLTVQCREQSN